MLREMGLVDTALGKSEPVLDTHTQRTVGDMCWLQGRRVDEKSCATLDPRDTVQMLLLGGAAAQSENHRMPASRFHRMASESIRSC